ncbi:hypothetical protein GpartN1_g2019.t1 [Galdieria partita]|uniref:Heme oxygenase n=1 Tax=Galdieria partita TaxID=83374 RepID=A0A9C7PT26_9RHOD|nr:hypothetical protein GpartN1_g2019.t1 [Galdieria partita]
MEDFWSRLRRETRREHNVSNTLVNLTLPFALSDRRVYVKALESFYYVYSTVEEEFDRQRRNFPKIGALYFEELRRKKSFERDLQFFLGDNWRQKLQGPSSTVARYIEHIKEVSSSKPWLILSYVITLYMALFRGGSILRKILVVSLALDKTSGEGVAIYDFPSIIDTEAFFKKYVETVNALTLPEEQKDEVIEEKRAIFLWNDEIFNEVRSGPYYRAILWRFFWSVVFVLVVVIFFLKKRNYW